MSKVNGYVFDREKIMKNLIIPKKLRQGDTIAFISLSGGRAGDSDMLPRYHLAKERFTNIYHVNVIETPHALYGSEYLYRHPEKRGEDLMWALKNPDVKGIICNMGGDDSYRVLPYIDPQVIHDNPKVFMGYSDIATWMAVFAYAGVRAFYGPNVLTPIGQPGSLDEYTKKTISKVLFESEPIGEIYPCDAFTPIEWNDKIKPQKIKWTKNDGFHIVQGNGTVQGRLFCLCGGPLQQIMGTKYFPNPDFFEGTFVAIEHGTPYGNAIAGLHCLRSFAAAGVFDKAAGILTGKMEDLPRYYIQKVINEEVHREDMVILENVDFVHHTPMTILPMGAMARIDCDNAKLTILEPGVAE